MTKLPKFFRKALMFFAVAALGLTAAAAPTWEKVGGVNAELVEQTTGDNIDVKVVDGAIVLTLTRQSNVKLFTILGQLVAEKQLEPGTWRFPLSARGIYILKTGSATRRITI